MIAVKVSSVKKTVNETQVLNNINLEFEQGKINGIVGDNFSGRIEILKILSGLIKEYDGEVKILENVLSKDTGYIDDIGMSFGIDGFIEEYTGLKNLKVLASIRGFIDENDIKDALCIMGILTLSKKKVKEYDFEIRKRLSIVQAIMEKPKLIVIDEPFMYLKEDGIEEVKKVLMEISSKRKVTIILGSRSDNHLKDICNNIYTIKNGVLQ